MSHVKSILDDLYSLKDTFDHLALDEALPIMLVPRNIYDAFWRELQREGFITPKQVHGDDIQMFSFIIRRQT